ncbi:MAG TPA: hypothetical protein VFA07_12650 [Chthonomonadaceae bacterium]|nr:hypothetical protein [Chthonomonadaceae bacterium]
MSTRQKIVRRAHSGQTLIVAIAVLFILLVIGALFITQIARNLAFAGRSRDTQVADALSRAGVQFCDRQLTNSEEGADWRPTPTAPFTSSKDPQGVADPDYDWLSAGFTRMPMTGGRALVRITYDPHPDDPHSQFIKIESIGRPGDIGNGSTQDPTVFVQSGAAPRLRRELVAYKQLALTDYLRFITDLDKTHKTASLGVPNIGHYVAMALNDPTTALDPGGVNNSHLIIGGGIRCNTDLQLLGDMFFYVSARGNVDAFNNPNYAFSFEGIQVAGNILLGPTRDVNGDGVLNDSDHQAWLNQSINQTPTAQPIIASNDPNTPFNTYGGLLRDGSPQPDANGYIRSIPRLDPPSLDTYVNGSGVLRYRALTRDSGAWVNDNTHNPPHYNTGFYGWGAGIYVNNPQDLQEETASSGAAYSMPRDWTNPQSGYGAAGSQISGAGWQGPHYVAPGLTVELMGDRIRLTRDDGQPFDHPDGTPITQNGGQNGSSAQSVIVPLADADRANWTFPDGAVYTLPLLSHDGDDPKLHTTAGQPYGDPNSYGVNVVIFAEGNVRVKGFYGAITDSRDTSIPHLGRVHITIVTGGTAYIEGNIVKNDGYLDANSNMIMERNSTCAILAHDYVCVNPTMFTVADDLGKQWLPGSGTTDPGYLDIGPVGQPQYVAGFSWGVNPNTYTYANGTVNTIPPPFVMLRHSSLNSGPSYINMLLNSNLGGPAYQFDPPNTGPPLLNTTGVVGWVYENGVWENDQAASNNAFDMKGLTMSKFGIVGIAQPGFDNLLQFQPDQSGASIPGASGQTDYLYADSIPAPLDIRIEALLYAEHRSFFVIPGYYANPEPLDSRQNFLQGNTANTRKSYNQYDAGLGADVDDKYRKDLYPFFGEPMDVRITIYGAVAENYTASQGDQTAWLEHWGYIPAIYGSTFADTTPPYVPQYVPDDHLLVHDPANYNPAEDRTQNFRTPQEVSDSITRGLRFEYDPALAMPYAETIQNGAVVGGPTDPGITNFANRFQWALRFIERPAVISPYDNKTVVLPEFRQALPPLPRLPVCPGLLYYGDSDRPIT